MGIHSRASKAERPHPGAVQHRMCFPHHVDDDLILTYLSPADADRFYALVDRNREHLGRWFSWVDQYQSVSDAVGFAEANLRRMAKLTGMTCLVWHRGDLAGLVDLLNVEFASRQVEIGFWLGEAFQGHGIARKAVAAVVGYAYRGLGFTLIQAKVRPGNCRSERLLAALHFTPEREGKSLVYKLTADCWVAANHPSR